jgi:hypothetical protein
VHCHSYFSFIFLLNYFALYLSQYNETFEFHQIITTCDSQVDHMWLTKVTSIKNNCDKFVNKIITNSFGIQKKRKEANMVVGSDHVRYWAHRTYVRFPLVPTFWGLFHQSVISMKFELIIMGQTHLLSWYPFLCQPLLKFITKYEFIRL